MVPHSGCATCVLGDRDHGTDLGRGTLTWVGAKKGNGCLGQVELLPAKDTIVSRAMGGCSDRKRLDVNFLHEVIRVTHIPPIQFATRTNANHLELRFDSDQESRQILV